MALDLGYLNPEGMNRLLQYSANEISTNYVEAELVTHKSDVRFLLSSYKPSDARQLQACNTFESIARTLAYMAHYIVLDLGPGISPITDKVLSICDEIIIVLEPIPNSITRTHLLAVELASRGFGEGRISTVLYNRQRTEMQYSLAQVQKEYQHGIALVFTAAPELTYQASKANQPLVIQHPDNLTSQQFSKLADNTAKHVRSKEI
jgi:MinD-like ATPase involved in chromosome partitioning or flagellar assembly